MKDQMEKLNEANTRNKYMYIVRQRNTRFKGFVHIKEKR